MELVSCVLPINKDEGFLDQAISSILNQTYSNIELIIVANNCSDQLWSKLIKLNDERIKCFRLSIGQLPFAINYGIEKANGEYIARMDADDISVPSRFEKQVKFLKSHPDYHIVGSNYQAINEKSKHVNFARKLYETDKQIKSKLPISNAIYHPTVMFRKDFIIEIRGYAYEFYAEDYELWLRARRLKKYKFYNINEKLLLYRIHQNQATSSQTDELHFTSAIVLRLREFLISKEIKFLIGILFATRPGRFIIRLNNLRKKQILK